MLIPVTGQSTGSLTDERTFQKKRNLNLFLMHEINNGIKIFETFRKKEEKQQKVSATFAKKTLF